MKKHILLLITATTLLAVTTYAQHVVVFKSGTKQIGKVVSLKDGILSMTADGVTNTYRVEEISSINFEGSKTAASGAAAPKSNPTGNPDEQSIISGEYTVIYKMPGRTIVKAPKVNNLTMEKGIVVVDITIDKYGNVMKAEPGASGSNTKSDYLYTMAKQAAESAKFDNVPKAPLQSKGTMTITF